MIGLGVAAAGVVLVSAGLIALFGAWAAVAVGVVLFVAGVAVDWESVHGKHPAPPPG